MPSLDGSLKHWRDGLPAPRGARGTKSAQSVAYWLDGAPAVWRSEQSQEGGPGQSTVYGGNLKYWFLGLPAIFGARNPTSPQSVRYWRDGLPYAVRVAGGQAPPTAPPSGFNALLIAP